MTNAAMKQVVSSNVVVLDASLLEPFEIGAHLEALLCHPGKTADDRQRIADAVCADIISQKIEAMPAEAASLRSRFPTYRKSVSRASLGSQAKGWDRGFVAGAYFLRQMKDTALREQGFAGDWSNPMSGRAIARTMWPANDEGYEVNYDSRLNDTLKHSIRTYYPVAHLAAAYQYLGRIADSEGIVAEFDYEWVGYHRMVVQLADRLAGYIQLTPGMGGVAAKLIKIEWRE